MTEARLWADSGAMALTGRPGGPPLLSRGAPATAVAAALARIAALHPEAPLPDVALLGERAAIAGLGANAPASAGGSFRTMATRDGQFGLTLARPSDLDLLPALVSAPEPTDDPWAQVTQWAARTTTAGAAGWARQLGLACCDAGAVSEPDREAIRTRRGGRRTPTPSPLVLDFSSLWAGPLCAHLLSLCGATVIKVESTERLDGARRGPEAFYDLLHHGHRSLLVDFTDPADLALLHRLADAADLVIEASRPRALRRLGLDADALVDRGTIWVSVTGYGRDRDDIGFGDDIAVGAGLSTPEHWPVGDALADPLTGVSAAASAVEALQREHGTLIDISMHHLARRTAEAAPTGGEVTVEVDQHGWWLVDPDGRHPVRAPRARPVPGAAAAAGADNDQIRARWSD